MIEVIKSGPKKRAITPITDKSLARFGCLHCEWKLSNKCPVYTNSYPDKEDPSFIHIPYPKKGICAERVNWLSSFLPVYQTEPSNSTIMLDLLKGMGHKRHLNDSDLLVGLEERLKKLEHATKLPDPELESVRLKELHLVRGLVDRRRKVLENTWRELMKAEDNQLTRETVKKIDITKRTITPMDVAGWIEEADYKELDDGSMSKEDTSSFDKEIE